MLETEFTRWSTICKEPVFLVDLEGEIVSSNPSAADLLKVPRPASLFGQPLSKFAGDSPEDVRKYLILCSRNVEAVPGALTLLTSSKERVECRCDGLTVNPEADPPERRIVIRCIPKPAANENFVALTQKIDDLAREIEGRKRAEASLRENQEDMQLILDSASEGIYGVDLSGVCTFCNKACAALLGYESVSDLIGRNVHEMIHQGPSPAETLAEDECLLCIANREGAEFHDDNVVLWRADGAALPAECWSHPMLRGGVEVGSVATFVDITDRRWEEDRRYRLDEQMRQAQKLESLGVLAGGIAHDFNNLLLGVMGNADMALLDLPETAGSRQHIDDIVKSAQRAADLCKQLLAYSGRGKFVLQAVDLTEVVEDMTHLLQISVSKKAVLKYDFARNLPAIEVDVTQLRQIIMNLITNASDAIGEKSGLITVRTGAMDCDRDYLSETYLDEGLPEGLYVYVEVSDTGCGMDGLTMARAFDPFFTTKEAGRGLGLAAVLGIVRSHDGALKSYSELGSGTTFKVLFPDTDLVATPLRESERPAEGRHPGGTILVVDDEETIRALARKILERFGFKVIMASDGRDAVEVFREAKDKIDAVLLDMTMPHLSGEEVYRELRKLRKDVRVVLTSGYNEQEATSHFAGKGLAGFIQKPYRARELVDTMRAILEKRESD